MTAAVLGALSPANVQASGSGLAEATVTRPPLKQEINRLLIADAAKAASAKPALPAAAADADEGVLTLTPMTVEGLPERRVTPFQETRTEKFFRTGAVVQHVGRKVTTRLWMKGDRGLMLSFDF